MKRSSIAGMFVMAASVAMMGSTALATYSGRIVSHTVPSTIYLGDSLPITVVVQNTGTDGWEGNEGAEDWASCWLLVDQQSWTIATYYYSWGGHYIMPGALETTSFWQIPPDMLPQVPGTYTMWLSGTFLTPQGRVALDDGPIQIQFRILQATSWKDGQQDLGGGWKSLSWFGYFYDAGNGWIYHNEHHWMYAMGTTPASIWLWTQDLGWLWTRSTTYPYLYRNTGGAWLWYLAGSSSPRWFNNLTTGHWESH